MIKNLGQMMKKAQEVQERMADMQARLDELKVDGISGAGMVRVTLNGKGEMAALRIDPELLDGEEAEMVEDLIVAAHADAKAKVEEAVKKEMAEITGGLPLPEGFSLPV